MAGGYFGGGDGSANTPYLVEDAQDFNAIRNTPHWCSFRQVADIDLCVFGTGFQPLGSDGERFFTGNYDGARFVIRNVHIDVDKGDTSPVSLFGYYHFAYNQSGTSFRANTQGLEDPNQPDILWGYDYPGGTQPPPPLEPSPPEQFTTMIRNVILEDFYIRGNNITASIWTGDNFREGGGLRVDHCTARNGIVISDTIAGGVFGAVTVKAELYAYCKVRNAGAYNVSVIAPTSGGVIGSLTDSCFATGCFCVGGNSNRGLLGARDDDGGNAPALLSESYAANQTSASAFAPSGLLVSHCYYDSDVAGAGDASGAVAATTKQMRYPYDPTGAYVGWQFVGGTVSGYAFRWYHDPETFGGYPYRVRRDVHLRFQSSDFEYMHGIAKYRQSASLPKQYTATIVGSVNTTTFSEIALQLSGQKNGFLPACIGERRYRGLVDSDWQGNPVIIPQEAASMNGTEVPVKTEIRTPEDLFNVRYGSGLDYVVKNTISLEGFTIPAHGARTIYPPWADGTFPPIEEQGSPSWRWSGTIDGQDFPILRMRMEAKGNWVFSAVGLIGDASASASQATQISNLHIKEFHIRGNISRDVGAFIGSGIGTRGVKLFRCSAQGSIVSTSASGGRSVGGLVGRLWTNTPNHEIRECFAEVDITGPGREVGGLVGYAIAQIEDSYARGTIQSTTGWAYELGGLVGRFSPFHSHTFSIKNCYSTGAVTLISDPDSTAHCGGLVGFHDPQVNEISNSYYDIETSGYSNDDGRGQPRTTEQMTYPHAEGTYEDWEFEGEEIVFGTLAGVVTHTSGVPVFFSPTGWGPLENGDRVVTQGFSNTANNGIFTVLNRAGVYVFVDRMLTVEALHVNRRMFYAPIWVIRPNWNDGYPTFGVYPFVDIVGSIDAQSYWYIRRLLEMWVKRSGEYAPVTGYVRHEGVYRPITGLYRRHDGQYKE